MGIWDELAPALPDQVQLHCLKLVETPKIFVEFYGEK
jgi:6-pyruvoyltetrahydropterin/6-carboxytetrahydropterin synthase